MEVQPVLCSNCNQSMCPIDISEVPTNILKDHIDSDNRLEDNWYWCSYCGKHEPRNIPVIRTPEEEKALNQIESFINSW